MQRKKTEMVGYYKKMIIRIITASSHALNTFVTDRQTDRRTDRRTEEKTNRRTTVAVVTALCNSITYEQTATDRTTAVILLLGNTAAVQPSSLAPRSGFPPNQLEGLWGCCKLHHSGLAVNDFYLFSAQRLKYLIHYTLNTKLICITTN